MTWFFFGCKIRLALKVNSPGRVAPAAFRMRLLERRIQGEVRFDEGSRALYATDLSIYRHVPVGVVIPREVDDVIETVAVCRNFGVPILGRGCGTSLAGQTCNVAVVIDFSRGGATTARTRA